MRLRTSAAVAATTVFGAGAAAVAAGRYGSSGALRRRGGSPAPPGFDPGGLTVHEVHADRLVLTRTLDSRRPGRYALTGPGRHVLLDAEVQPGPTPDTVVRGVLHRQGEPLRPGDRLWATPQLYVGDPREALGLEYADATVPGELGPLPAWFVPGDRDTWVLACHGPGTTREHPMVLLPLLHRLRTPVLLLTHRGDAGAPAQPDGVGHLGSTEWRDLDAAMRYALRYGARRLVLLGWSTGASTALHAAAHSALRRHLAGLVLDSPVLDWRATVRALAAGRVPRPLLPLAVRAAQGRAALDAEALDRLARPDWLTVPALIVHGRDDTVAPWAASRAFADARQELVGLHTVPHAAHAACWNADREPYEEALRRFLTPLL